MPDSIIGQPLDRVDGKAKVTGTARYAADTKTSTPPAVGVIVTSTIGRGEIDSIDAEAAKKAPGVLLVMNHDNVPPQGAFKAGGGGDRNARAKPQFAENRVHYHGEAIAL